MRRGVWTAGVVVGAAAAATAKAQEQRIMLDEVVVEGERSGRLLSETPASTVVLSGEEVDRPQNLDSRAVADGVANVVYDDGALLPSVRGIDGSAGQIGGSAFTTGAQPRVNVIVDGVARPVNVGGGAPTLTSLWDTEQVEVARGPQSTLGGRNSLAGNIRIATRDPIFEFESAARVFGFTQDGTLGAAGMVNLPLIEDQLALRVTAEGSDGETFVQVVDPAVADDRDKIEDEEFRRFRGKLLFAPTAVPGLELIAAIERTESFGLFQQETTDPDADPPIIEDFAAIGSNNDNEQTVYSLQGRYAVSEQIEFEARAAFVDNEFAIPPTNPIFDLTQDNESFSAEALIRATDIGFLNRAVFGVTYERQTDVGENVSAALPLSFDGEIESVGIFGELEIGVTEKLALIAGARLEIDDRERELTFAADEAALDISDTRIIPRLGLRYDFSEDLTVGYFYSEGYRPGGIDFDFLNLVAGATTYGPETLRQHEVFARARFLDGRATLNVSGFYYEFDDAQISGAGPGGLFGNVPKARGIGGEAEATFALAGGVTVGGALGLLDAKITDPGPNLAEFDGAELPRAPNLTLSGFVAYQSDFGFDARAQIRHIGSRVAALDSPTSPSYTIVDFSAGYEFTVGENAYLRIEAFVQNLADEDVVISAFEDGSEVVGRPRTIGIGGTIRF